MLFIIPGLRTDNLGLMATLISNAKRTIMAIIRYKPGNISTLMKSKPLTKANIRFLKEFKQAVREVKLCKAGKLKAISADEWLKQLK